MKYVKMLGLLAVAAAALMAFAGSASATILTSPEGSTYTGEIVATSTNSELDGAFVTVKCGHSEAKGSVENHGGERVSGPITTLTFTTCNYHTTVENKGTLEVDTNGTVYSKEAKVTINTSVGSCTFTTAASGTDVGTLSQGKGASLNINSAKIPRTAGNFLCGSSGTWTGSYDLVTPNDLWVD